MRLALLPLSAGPARGLQRSIWAASWLGYGMFVHRVKIRFLRPVTFGDVRTWSLDDAQDVAICRSAPELVTSIRIVCGKGEGRMSWSWRDLVVLTFLVILFGAAMVANVGDGPLHEYRGSWVARASR